jgi:O-phospho-L-seryl-tRNASec:L-selenocysteinyl-tRNA synthase
MNSKLFDLSSGFIGKSYSSQAEAAKNRRSKQIQEILANRKLPVRGWDEFSVESFLWDVSGMDSNNFLGNVGGGEREGRVYSSLVRRRHFGMAHGIGRSGDIAAVQPKAAGSSLLKAVTKCLTLHALQIAGGTETKDCLVLPLATGECVVCVV